VGFTAGFWSLTFSWSAIALFAIRWLHIEHPAGETAYAGLALGGVTLLIGAIAAWSLLAIARGQFLPPLPAIRRATEAPLAKGAPPRRLARRYRVTYCRPEGGGRWRLKAPGPPTNDIAHQE
jgi:hypothetical protein